MHRKSGGSLFGGGEGGPGGAQNQGKRERVKPLTGEGSVGQGDWTFWYFSPGKRSQYCCGPGGPEAHNRMLGWVVA